MNIVVSDVLRDHNIFGFFSLMDSHESARGSARIEDPPKDDDGCGVPNCKTFVTLALETIIWQLQVAS